MRAIPDIIQLCKEALKNHPGDSQLKEELEDAEDAYSHHAGQVKHMLRAQGMTLDQYAWGMIAIKLYPWTPAELRMRDDETIALANKMLESCSDSLEIRPSSLGNLKKAATAQCLGVFAKRDIKKGEKLLDAPSATGTSNKPTTGQYCYNCAAKLKKTPIFSFSCCPAMKFCGEECKNIAEINYHTAICGKDFSELYKAASSQDFAESSKARDNLQILRLLAVSLQAGTHPLKTPPIGWLVANYEAQSPIPWSRGANITGPLRTLQILGVDIFAEEYDTWALQTMWSVNFKVKGHSEGYANIKNVKEPSAEQL
jgi:hypothetical protein